MNGLLALALGMGLSAASDPIAWQAEEAEKRGDVVRAWTLYTRAAALDGDKRSAGKALALRSAALEKATIVHGDPAEGIALDPGIVHSLTPQDLDDLKRLKAPPELRPAKKRQRFDLRGPVRDVWTATLRACGIDVVFDGDFNVITTVQLRLDDADCGEAVRALETVSGCFISPLGEKLAMVVRDTQEKRREQERTVAVSIPLPEPVSVQEAQELARGVQQTFEIQKFAIDSVHRIVMIRDRFSKVRPAQMMFEQLLLHRPQVVVDVDFFEINDQRDTRFGINVQNITQIVNFGTFMNNKPALLPQFTKFLTFGGGLTMFGIGIADSSLFASMTASKTQVKLSAQIRSLDGQAATFHVGDRYPILTQGYFGGETPGPGTNATVFRPPPTVQFEDLGLSLKITPRVHDAEDVTLAVESEFKVLTSQELNGIPVIANRKYTGQVRLRSGEWAICAGLVGSTDVQGYTGIAGLSQIPGLGWGLRDNSITKNRGKMLLVLKPRIVNFGPTEYATKDLWVGTETKPLPPI